MTSSPDRTRAGRPAHETDRPDPGVTEALEGLTDLDVLPVAEHVERFEAVHESLAAALAAIDEV